MTRRAPGFSLIEMAFVLIIVTLLLGGLLVPFATQVEQKRIAETNKALEEIKEALMGFAVSHSASGGTPRPYLPCPDTSGDGLEDRDPTTGDCLQSFGNLPWATLGNTPTDAWGNRFHYSVTNDFSNSINGFGLGTFGALTVCENAKSNTVTNCAIRIATTIPALVLSYGKNGYSALNAGGSVNQQPTSADEIENTQADPDSTFYVSRVITPVGAPVGEFDDLVVWLSPNVLFNRMVAAGRLP